MSTATRDRPIRLLLIDDDRDDYLLTRETVADIPGGQFSLDWEREFDAGIEAICRGQHDVYLIDYRIGDRTGLDLWREARERACPGPMILLTGQSEYEIDVAALAAGAAEFLEKDRLEPKLLERAIRYAIRQHENERALERKVAERTAALKAANEELKDLARRKDEYLATLGHELRNPLAPMRNALEIMRIGEGSPEVVSRARGILDRQVRTMVRLIDDLLDVSRFFTGKFRLNVETVDLGDAVRDAVESVTPLFQQGEVTLTTDLPDEPVRVRGDRLRIAQVFTNVLANAAKYTPAGGACRVAVARAGDHAIASVSDNGMGIPADVLPHVFDLFTQVDRTLDRARGGLGIGLALVRKLVEMHNGTVTAHSDGAGTGTRFDFQFPLATSESSTQSPS
jgi:signal transduction histidine kinase